MSAIHELVRVVKVGLLGITDGKYAVLSYSMRITFLVMFAVTVVENKIL